MQNHYIQNKFISSKRFQTLISYTALLLALFALPHLAIAKQGQYLSKDQLLNLAFSTTDSNAKPYAMETLWLTKDIKKSAESILGHPLNKLRYRYWRQKDRTVWIINEIGKVKPITTGIIIENNTVISIHILKFRESRGWEVKYPFFTEQFIKATLTSKNKLSNNIDGITGATLSVRAVKKVTRLALFFHSLLGDKSL